MNQLGVHCGFCGEPVDPREQDEIYRQPMHRECGMRLVVGSVAHLERRCSCYVPGSDAADPPGMTLRQAATHACRLYYLMGERN